MNWALTKNAVGGVEFTNFGALIFFGVVALGVWFILANRPEPAYQLGNMVETVQSGEKAQIVEISCQPFAEYCSYEVRFHTSMISYKEFELVPYRN